MEEAMAYFKKLSHYLPEGTEKTIKKHLSG
jgi:hypothetical protein